MKQTEWWRGAVIYQIYPRSFNDSNGDGIGDLKGITQKLDYVAALGVDAIWISPFFKSPMDDFGYDVSDYQEVDPIFGTMDDFDEMLSEMHKRGLKLIIDLVLNHTSEQHPWFTESRKNRDNPKADWYVWADPHDDGTPPNNWLSVFGGAAWQYDTRRGQYYYHQFLKEQPDLNLRNPEVQDKLLEIAEWWLKKGVDGFRLDALNHGIHDAQLRNNPPKEDVDRSKSGDRGLHPYYWQRHLYDKTQPEMIPFIKRLRALTDKFEDRMMVAEIGDDNQNKTSVAYTDGPKCLHTAYSFAILGLNQCRAKEIRDIIEGYFNEPGDSWPSWAFSNHDIKRVASRWALNDTPSPAQAKQLIALLTTLPGTSFIYEGEELGLEEADIPFEKLQDPFGKFLWPEDKGRDGCRTPMPWQHDEKNAGFSTADETWLPIPESHIKGAVSQAETDPDSTLNFTKNFFEWRKKFPALKTGKSTFESGKSTFADIDEPLLCFTRRTGEEEIFVIFNLSDKEQIITLDFIPKVLEGHQLPYSLEGDVLTLPAFGGFFAQK